MLAGVVLLLCFGIYLAVSGTISVLPASRSERLISIEDVYPFLEEGEVFSLSDAFPFDWDEVQIANAPGGIGDFYTEIKEFDSSFRTWHDIHFLVIFYREGKVIEYFQYRLGKNNISPIFGENHQFELGWHKRIPREEALFFCDGFQGVKGIYVCSLSSSPANR